MSRLLHHRLRSHRRFLKLRHTVQKTNFRPFAQYARAARPQSDVFGKPGCDEKQGYKSAAHRHCGSRDFGKASIRPAGSPSTNANCLAIVAQDCPWARARDTLAVSTAVRGRPRRLPFALAFLIPALTRSMIKLRSSSATAPSTVKTIRPAGVDVSRFSERLTKSIPRALKVSRALSRCETERTKRSNFQTITASKRRLWASAISLSSWGRDSFEPETPSST